MSGQPTALMHAVLQDVAGRVVNGNLRLESGTPSEGTLAWFPLLAERLRPARAGELLAYASWFHRRPVSALQLVWPDARGLFSWQPGGTDTSYEQPPGWRRPAARTGCFAVDPPWVWPVPADHVMVGCRHVVEAGAAVATVLRVPLDDDEVWAVLCEQHDDLHGDLVAAHFAHYARSMPALRDVADLAVGEGATRSDPGAPWSRFRMSGSGGPSA